MRRILITGATAGIGRACADHFARQGWFVTAVARTAADLAALAHEYEGLIETVAADLATPEGRAAVPVRGYSALLLNAANFQAGTLLGPQQDPYGDGFALNVLANHELARTLVPLMIGQGGGSLVLIGSTGTDDWPEGLTAYCAGKYAARGLYLGWERELAETVVAPALVAPSATLTRSWAGQPTPPDILSPETVAETVYAVVSERRRGRVVIRPGGG